VREERELRLLAALYTPQVVRAMAERAVAGDVGAARLVLEVAGLLKPHCGPQDVEEEEGGGGGDAKDQH